jgi:DNA modification methylase
MSDDCAAAVFTDPPYNVRIDGHASGLGAIRHREFAMASGEMAPDAFTRFLGQTCTLLTRYSRDGSIHYICMDFAHMHELLDATQLIYSELKNLCVWAKDNAGMGSFYRSQHELVFVFKHGRAPHCNNVQLGKHGRNRTNVWNYPSARSFSRASDEGNLLALHPTIKPVRLVADALLDSTAPGDIVLDAFLGSGTTLIAAERVRRRCYGVEIDPLYVDTAIRRWQAYTGDAAAHAVTGRTFDEISRTLGDEA